MERPYAKRSQQKSCLRMQAAGLSLNLDMKPTLGKSFDV